MFLRDGYVLLGILYVSCLVDEYRVGCVLIPHSCRGEEYRSVVVVYLTAEGSVKKGKVGVESNSSRFPNPKS